MQGITGHSIPIPRQTFEVFTEGCTRSGLTQGFVKNILVNSTGRWAMFREWQMEHQRNVVVVNNQSAKSKFFELPFDWMLTMTSVPFATLWPCCFCCAAKQVTRIMWNF